jgi:[ribosomal protein S5]-alanine N-acetyltransferase
VNARVEHLATGDTAELLSAIVRSRDLHAPWGTPPATADELREMLDRQGDEEVRYGVRAEDGGLAGVISLTSIVRGAFQSCFLGYFAVVPYEGHGYVRAGLEQVLNLAFGEHGLHRVEASVQPGNARSARLLEGLGFRLEGHSPRYLKIAGAWRDHDHYAMTAEEWPGRAPTV